MDNTCICSDGLAPGEYIQCRLNETLIDGVIQHRVCIHKCLLEITEPSGATGHPGLAGVWELGMIIVGDEARKVGSVQTLKA